MRVLVGLPLTHPDHPSIDALIDGSASCSGTVGAIVRTAHMLKGAGYDVTLSAAGKAESSAFPCVTHGKADAKSFDHIIPHQSHWDGATLSYGNGNLSRTHLWFQNPGTWSFAQSFFQRGGKEIVCLTRYHANTFRALPAWGSRVKIAYNSYCGVFEPQPVAPERRLLFVGAITPTKGFDRVMALWSHIAAQGGDLKLVIAGSIGVHKGTSVTTGRMGIAERDFEVNEIEPWMASLPETHKPEFLGALSPLELREEMARSWAVLVNPSWTSLETFCVAAVEAQVCERTVFSVAGGGLNETVYQGGFPSLTKEEPATALGDLILKGLENYDAVLENGKKAAVFARETFSDAVILDSWERIIGGRKDSIGLDRDRTNSRDMICDLVRLTKTTVPFEKYVLHRK